jgi:hypothetical protein
MSFEDPYRHHGLRENPFAHGAGGPQAAASWVDRGHSAPVEPGRRRLVQVIGVKGAGKTSTLRRWRLAAPGTWRHVPPGARRLRPLPVAPLVYWDEADRAPAAIRWWGWRTAARRGATVVAGTHVDLEAEALAAGLTVDSVFLAAISAEELTAWAAQRFAAIEADPAWALPQTVAVEVASQAGASWRVAGDLLHAWVAREIDRRHHRGTCRTQE